MRLPLSTAAAALLALTLCLPPALAGDTDPLFVNLTTDDTHRVTMALTFSANQQERKHPVAIFLNDRAVFVGSKSQGGRFATQQGKLKEMMAKGVDVYICPMCAQHYGVDLSDLLEGIKPGTPDAVGALLFRDGGKTLTW
jgi:sulfur relay (sulfurtransferase) complex TusBCD TusD component (DsrE family)